jgi:hypothetical protein
MGSHRSKAYGNKNGFLEKQAFLQRADHRAHDAELEYKDSQRLKRGDR